MDFAIIRKLFHCEINNGFSEQLIQQAIERIGGLPKVLQEYYRQLGAYEELNSTRDMLCSPARLTVQNDYLCFYKEEQDTVRWCIKIEDIKKDNPPVYCYLWRDNSYVYVLESNTLMDFLNAMAYFQALYYLPYNSEGYVVCDDKMKELIKKNFEKKNFGFLSTPIISFYANNADEVICISEDAYTCQIAYACTKEEQLLNIEKIISKTL